MRLKIYIYLIALMIFRGLSIFGQNLVPNSSFNEFEVFMDENYNTIYQPKYWQYNTLNSPHPLYFSTPRFLDKSIIKKIHPDSREIYLGDTLNYIGIPVLPTSEIVYTKLNQTLITGKKYKISLDFRLFGISNCMANLIIGFSSNMIDTNSYVQLTLPIVDSVKFKDAFYNWNCIEVDYTAKGSENYLIIGSFEKNEYLKFIEDNERYDNRNKFFGELTMNYSIDNVFIVPYNALSSQQDSLTITDKLKLLEFGDNLVLSNVIFEFDSSTVLPQSYVVLDELSDYLRNNKDLDIKILGYTDNIGTNLHNDKLSLDRSRSVANYFIQKEVDASRIATFGYGSKRPVVSNNTERGRQINRRVEIILIDKSLN